MSIDIDEDVLKNGKEAIRQNMFDALDEFVSEYAEEMEQVVEEITRLQAENAELRDRLSRAVELPCKVGDTVYTVTFQFRDGWTDKGEVVHKAGYYMQIGIVTADNLFKMCDLIQRGAAFLSKEAAEARLKELER